MTYDRLKTELQTMRENRQERKRIFKEIEELDRRKYDRLVNVTDTTREPTQRTTGTDDRLITAIERHEARRTALYKKLDALPPDNQVIKEALLNMQGVNGLILLYYTQGQSVKEISKVLNISPSYIYAKINKATEALWYSLQSVEV